MKMPFSLFLAFKYLKPHRSFVSAVTVISMLGVTIGVAILIVVLSVMTGFDETWRDRMLAFTSHLEISRRGGRAILDPEVPMKKIASLPGVEGVAPRLEGMALLQFGERPFAPVMLEGVDPQREGEVSRVPNAVLSGRFDLDGEKIVIGSALARSLGVGVGDVLTVYSSRVFAGEDEIRLPLDLTISGIYSVGMYEYDAGFAFVSLGTARDVFAVERGVGSIVVKLKDPMRAPSAAVAVRRVLGPGWNVTTWMEKNRQMFSALRVEKNMMFFLLAFVALVAAFSISNTLITLTIQKTPEIGLLKALGFSNRRVTSVFLWMGFIQGVAGSVLGVGVGLLVLCYRNEILEFFSRELDFDLLPPELYQLSRLPSHTLPSDVAIVCLLVLVFCTLAGLVPALRAARMEPVEALRHE